MLSPLYQDALKFAVESHAGQKRKGTGAPYISHPLAVSSLVMEYGGDETQMIAALLHDTIEDCGVQEAELLKLFGHGITKIIVECTEPLKAVEPIWKQRKLKYIQQMENSSVETLLVAASDKYHNMSSTLRDLRHLGPQAWTRFHRNTNELLWYYETLVTIFTKRKDENTERFKALVKELDIVLMDLKKLA